MTDPAAILAHLVDIRNIGHDKCIKLTLHVPAEQAQLVIDAFGWPTNIDPVPVAVARLNVNAGEVSVPSTRAAGRKTTVNGADTSASRRGEPAPDKRSFTELPFPQQAALLCQDPRFWAFLNEEYKFNVKTSDSAAEALRECCVVDTRAKLLPGTVPGDTFVALRDQFTAWKLVAA